MRTILIDCGKTFAGGVPNIEVALTIDSVKAIFPNFNLFNVDVPLMVAKLNYRHSCSHTIMQMPVWDWMTCGESIETIAYVVRLP